MAYDIPDILLGFLGACVYADPVAFYRALDDAGRARLKREAAERGRKAWLYRYLYDVLPEAEREDCRRFYLSAQVDAVRDAHELDRLFAELNAHGLRFAPVKRADLAFRVYPDAALRRGNDWDVWFHPDDCERALDVLAETGWRVPSRYADSNGAVSKTALHHYSPHVRNHCTLEPHYTLPNFEGVDPREMWSYTLDLPDGGGRHVLSPELNLLMLARHAASKSYYHADLPKLLADAAMVMKHDPVDFAKLRAMADRWRLPYPGDLLAAFPEFFPAPLIESFRADPAKTDLFRRIFRMRGEMGDPNTTKLTMARKREKGVAVSFLAHHFLTLGPYRMRGRYHLPAHGAYGRLCLSYLDYLLTRTGRVFSVLLGRERRLEDYCRLVESVESPARRSH